MNCDSGIQWTETIERFNFFMVFFSVVIAGAVNSRSQQHLELVLTLGSGIASLLALALARSHYKLDTILKTLGQDESHPATIIDKQHDKRKSVRKIIGLLIPIGCTAILMLAALGAWTGCIVPGTSAAENDLRELRVKVDQLAAEIASVKLAEARLNDSVASVEKAIAAVTIAAQPSPVRRK